MNDYEYVLNRIEIFWTVSSASRFMCRVCITYFLENLLDFMWSERSSGFNNDVYFFCENFYE